MRVANSKRIGVGTKRSTERMFPYYAGFSTKFVKSCLSSLQLSPEATILDPWNGSGTTTLVVAKSTRISGIGLDLNPVMVVAAKAQLLTSDVNASLQPLARKITDVMSSCHVVDDPLCSWFEPRTAAVFRGLTKSISATLVPSAAQDLWNPASVTRLSGLASFYYLALFRTARKCLQAFVPSNPTWIRIPKPHERLALKDRQVASLFLREVRSMCAPRFRGFLPPQDTEDGIAPLTDRISIAVGDARAMGIPRNTIDAVITSPPYCTRID